MRLARGRRRAGLVIAALLVGACADRQLVRSSPAPIDEPVGGSEPVGAGSSAERRDGPANCPAAVRQLVQGGALPTSLPAARDLGLALFEEEGRELVSLRLDMPVPVVRQLADVGSRCLLMIEAESAGSDSRVLAHETIWSERVSAVVRRPNPDYEAARREVARLADRLDREDREQARDLRRLTPTGNAWVDALGLVGGLVLGGIGSFARDQEFADARAKLESIPRWIEETRFEPYRVTVVDTEVTRRADVRLALVDSESGRFWVTTVPVARTDRLRVALDLHPGDRSRVEGNDGLVGPADLEAAAAAPPPLALSELLPHLAASVANDPGRPGGPHEVRLAWAETKTQRLAGSTSPSNATAADFAAQVGASIASATATAKADRGHAARPETGSGSASRTFASTRDPAAVAPSSSSNGTTGSGLELVEFPGGRTTAVAPASALVKVEGAGGRAHGFYVGPEKVLTLARALGGSSLARIETADGFVTWGVIDREDPVGELLLVHVPRKGRPLPVGGASSAAFTGPLPEPGLPILLDGRVVAVSLDPLEGRAAGPNELARLLGEPGSR
ncbi:MAG: hypothetical protein KatS3mg117_0488 [Geminicoccaceae bacterium]|nr:MAG: hypothetical protein KatS3mg117_0488 [Geminicoccaceae bacterium]